VLYPYFRQHPRSVAYIAPERATSPRRKKQQKAAGKGKQIDYRVGRSGHRDRGLDRRHSDNLCLQVNLCSSSPSVPPKPLVAKSPLPMINDISASDAPGLDEYLKASWRASTTSSY
jgi:hypothetical protein